MFEERSLTDSTSRPMGISNIKGGIVVFTLRQSIIRGFDLPLRLVRVFPRVVEEELAKVDPILPVVPEGMPTFVFICTQEWVNSQAILIFISAPSLRFSLIVPKILFVLSIRAVLRLCSSPKSCWYKALSVSSLSAVNPAISRAQPNSAKMMSLCYCVKLFLSNVIPLRTILLTLVITRDDLGLSKHQAEISVG